MTDVSLQPSETLKIHSSSKKYTAMIHIRTLLNTDVEQILVFSPVKNSIDIEVIASDAEGNGASSQLLASFHSLT